ncbi:MAG: hypothetical protein KF805_14625 [Phycisphaeraceae bacterium]|nr:hypothetical protein [Phycisphaeraceae bacterium]
MPESGDIEHEDTGHATSPAATVTRFRLHPIPAAIALVATVAVVVGAFRALSLSGADPRRIGEAMGTLIGLLLWPLLVGWAVFRLAGRSNRAGNWAFTIMLLLCLGAYSIGLRAAAPQQRAADTNPASLAEIRAISEEARKASLDGDDEKAIRLTAESAKKLEAVAATSQGSDKAVMEYAAALAKAQNEILKKYIDAAGKYADAGGADLSGLSDAPGVEARLALLDQAIVAHDNVIEYFSAIENRIPKDLAERGANEKDAAQFLSGFLEKANLNNLLAIHRLEHGMLLASKSRFELLRANAGRWTVDANGELIAQVEFPDSDLAEFNRLGKEIDSLAEKQGVLVEQRKAGG